VVVVLVLVVLEVLVVVVLRDGGVGAAVGAGAVLHHISHCSSLSRYPFHTPYPISHIPYQHPVL
jgi:hypothetical protein